MKKNINELTNFNKNKTDNIINTYTDLDIIDELDLAKVMKAKIKNRPDLGKDERVGRRVIFEFNKSYPVVLSPMLDKESLKEPFLEYLSYYYDISEIRKKL